MAIRTCDGFLVSNHKEGDLSVTVIDGLGFKSIQTKKEKLKQLYQDYKNSEHQDIPNAYKTEESSGVGNQQRVRAGEILTNSIYSHIKCKGSD